MNDRIAGVELAFKSGKRQAQRKQAASEGIAAEIVFIASATPLDFAWRGDVHYVGLHDLDLRDGETLLEGAAKSTLHDLRNKLTFVPAGATISGWSAPKQRSNSFTGLYFEPLALREELQHAYANAELAPALYFDHAALAATMGKLQQLLQSPVAASRLYVETLGTLAALELAQRQQGGAIHAVVPKGGLAVRQEKLVRDYIESRLSDDLSLTELAKLAGLTRFHFARAFKVVTGLPPHRFVLDRRIERARILLTTTDLDLRTIAEEVGLGSAAQLTRTFRKYTGIPAGAFRKRAP